MNPNHMKTAIQLALKSVQENKGGPFGAVIVKDDKIISQGCNLVTPDLDPTAHAEIVAIRQACQKLKTFTLKGCEIYTSCEPCPMCLSAIYWARLDKVYYSATKIDAQIAGFDDDFIYRELVQNISNRKLPMVRMLPNEALKAFDAWKKSETKVCY